MMYNGDHIEMMTKIADGSVDMVLCDLPYGTTLLDWDVKVNLADMWQQYDRVCKKNAAIVLFGSQPFSAELIYSNMKYFRYEYVWIKNTSTNFANSKKMPLKKHENILVFYKKLPTFNQQALREVNKKTKQVSRGGYYRSSDQYRLNKEFVAKFTGYQNSLLYFDSCKNSDRIHNSQKPVELLKHLILTYTNEGETVLDNTAGSGATGIACIDTNRKYILIEKDAEIYEKSKKWIDEHHAARRD